MEEEENYDASLFFAIDLDNVAGVQHVSACRERCVGIAGRIKNTIDLEQLPNTLAHSKYYSDHSYCK